MNIALLIPKSNLVVSSVSGPIEIFNKVNIFNKTEKGFTNDFYSVKIFGGAGDQKEFLPGVDLLHFEKLEAFGPQLIILPAFDEDPVQTLAANTWIGDTINYYYSKKGVELAGLCMGTFFIASSGLLNDRSCTVHWIVKDVFRQAFPAIKLLPENIITDEGGIYTSGGAYSFLNLILYLVEKFSGREAAIWAAKVFEIDMGRSTQAFFSIFNNQKLHQDEQVKLVQSYIEQHYEGQVRLDQLAAEVGLSERNLARRFKRATGNTPIEYCQRVRVEAAKKLLETGTEGVNEAMYASGYNDPKTFRMMFKKHTGLSPSAYRGRYARAITKIA